MDGLEVANERDVQKYWYQGLLADVQPAKIRNASRSFDELVLAQLFRQVLPEAEVLQQTKWGRRSIDFWLKDPNLGELIVEFHGPSHFAPSRYRSEVEDPVTRKNQIEKEFGVECVIWPYWIQRCELNVRALFDSDILGLGALWSANTHFGDFAFENAAVKIEQISMRFNAKRSGYGYFYGPSNEGRQMIQHPIVDQIRLGKVQKSRLLPSGYASEADWLPPDLL